MLLLQCLSVKCVNYELHCRLDSLTVTNGVTTNYLESTSQFSSWLWQWHSACTLCLKTLVCTIGGTCSCFEMAPGDFPDFFKSIICFLRSVLSSLDSSIVAFVAESKSHTTIFTEESTALSGVVAISSGGPEQHPAQLHPMKSSKS